MSTADSQLLAASSSFSQNLLQVLFGIKGARWDNYPPYSKYYNEYWVRAPKTEAPSRRFANKLDNGCYW